jgi:ketosteroid isomerase-like protein
MRSAFHTEAVDVFLLCNRIINDHILQRYPDQHHSMISARLHAPSALVLDEATIEGGGSNMRLRTVMGALLLMFAVVSFAAAADSKPQNEVRKASEQFYAALNRMLNGNAGPLTAIWSHGAAVTTMHPIGGREVGWDQVRGSWEQVAKLASDGKVELKDQRVQVSGNMAYEVGVEHGQFKLAGQQVNIESRVTNIYQRETGTWKIVHHHVDVSPAMVDIVSRLQPPAK